MLSYQRFVVFSLIFSKSILTLSNQCLGVFKEKYLLAKKKIIKNCHFEYIPTPKIYSISNSKIG